MVFPHEITVIKIKDEELESYDSTIVKGVLIAPINEGTKIESGIVPGETAQIYIPGTCIVRDASFLSLLEIKSGDIIVQSSINTENLTLHEIKTKYNNTVDVMEVDEYNFGGLPNIVLHCR